MGKKYSGKDTLGKFFIERYKYKHITFAQPLKEMIQNVFSITKEQLNEPILKEEKDEYWQVSPRQMMQFIGTELFRDQMKNLIPNIEEDVWIKILERKIMKDVEENKGKDNENKYVITDVRFKNEINFIRKNNGIIIKMYRNVDNKIDEHKSENEVEEMDYDYLVENNGTIEELYDNVKDKNIVKE